MFFAPGLVSANYRLQVRNAPIEHKTVLRDMIHRNNREPPDNIPNSTTDRMARIWAILDCTLIFPHKRQ